MTPRDGDRILYTNDIPSGFEWVPYNAPPEALHEQVDLLAENGVDLYGQDVFHGVTMFKSEFCDTFGYVRKHADWAEVKFHQFLDQGIEPIDVWTARCHAKGIRFIAGFRMNDRHSQGVHRRFSSRFLWDNPKWWLREFPGSLDFSFPQVRDWIFNTMRECVQRFDVDGLELNYMRSPYVFPTNESARKHPVLTEFMQQIREMVNHEAKRRGRALLLGAWTPQSLRECHDLGMDVPTWIQRHLVDYVVPGDFGSNDMNMPCDEFAQLTRQSSCRLYPAIHPRVSRRHHPRTLLSLSAHRGAVRNFYAQGADGFALFNYIYHWDEHHSLYGSGPRDCYPAALSRFTHLREPGQLENPARHYVFFPITDMGAEYPGITLRDHLFMPLTREPWKPGRGSIFQQRAFRVAEDFSDTARAVVRFRATGLMPRERLEIHFDGHRVADDLIQRTHYPDGKGGGWDDGPAPQTLARGYTIVEFTPPAPAPAPVPGDRASSNADDDSQYADADCEHVLGIELTASDEPTWNDDGSLNQIVIDEVEVVVAGAGESPQDIFSQIREHVPPPMPVLAGYHPAATAAWREKCKAPAQVDGDDGSLGRTISVAALAQCFELARPANVAMVDVLLQPQPAGAPDAARRAVKMTLCTDGSGHPGEPVDARFENVTCRPLDHADGLPCSLQGYYEFKPGMAIQMAPGRYWLVIENAVADEPGTFAYQPLFAPTDKCAAGPLLTRSGRGHEWHQHPHMLFFGVHASD